MPCSTRAAALEALLGFEKICLSPPHVGRLADVLYLFLIRLESQALQGLLQLRFVLRQEIALFLVRNAYENVAGRDAIAEI